MKIILFLSLIFSFSSFGQSKEDVNKMLDQMKAQGVFSDADLEAARSQLNSMSEKEFKTLSNNAQKAAKDPAYQQKAKEILQNRNAGKVTP